jgi:sec-independent protein translocase protein TatA
MFAMFGLGMYELIIVGVVAVLLFGKRLPEVAKSLGKSYSEFRRGLSDIQSHMDVTSDIYSATSSSSSYSTDDSSYDEYDDYDEATAPKFEPPPAEPQEESASERQTAEAVDSAAEQQNPAEESR